MRTQHLPGVKLGREFPTSYLTEGGGFTGATDEHHDGTTLRQARFSDGQAPAAARPLSGGEAGAGLLTDQRALRPERSDMTVVAEAEDAEVEGLGGRTLGPAGLIGGRGLDRGELDGPREAAGGGADMQRKAGSLELRA